MALKHTDISVARHLSDTCDSEGQRNLLLNKFIKDLASKSDASHVKVTPLETGDYYVLKVQNFKNHRMLRFEFPKHVAPIRVFFLERTHNIAEDLDAFYQGDDCTYKCFINLWEEIEMNLFLSPWFTSEVDRRNDVMSVPAFKMKHANENPTNNQTLLFGIIEKVEPRMNILGADDEVYTIVKITMEDIPGTTEVEVAVDNVKDYRPGKLLVVNYKGSCEVFAIDKAKKYLRFTPGDWCALLKRNPSFLHRTMQERKIHSGMTRAASVVEARAV